LLVNAHVVFSRIREHEITTVRILHGAMNAAAVFQQELLP
jgi:plasmid stabilization system protein ParE